MAWYDKAKNLMDRVMQGPMEPAGGQSPVTMMETGERRGFRPGVPHLQVEASGESQVFPPVSDTRADGQPDRGKKRRRIRDLLLRDDETAQDAQPGTQQAPQNSAYQNPAYQNSGYYQPVQNAYQPVGGYEQGAYQPMGGYEQTGYQTQDTGFGQPGFQQPVQSQPVGQNGYAQSGYQPPMSGQPYTFNYDQPAQNMGYSQSVNQAQSDVNGYSSFVNQQQSYTAGFQQPQSAPEQRRKRMNRNQQAAEQYGDNVLYMNPDNVVDENGTAYSMVVHLAQPTSMPKCYRLIEFMRSNQTVLVNLEQIRDEKERSRCLDLLYGAAYAMDWKYTKVAEQCIYLITPRGVGIIPYNGMNQLNQRDNASRWPGAEADNPLNQGWDVQRERQAAGGYQSASSSKDRYAYRANPVRYY